MDVGRGRGGRTSWPWATSRSSTSRRRAAYDNDPAFAERASAAGSCSCSRATPRRCRLWRVLVDQSADYFDEAFAAWHQADQRRRGRRELLQRAAARRCRGSSTKGLLVDSEGALLRLPARLHQPRGPAPAAHQSRTPSAATPTLPPTWPLSATGSHRLGAGPAHLRGGLPPGPAPRDGLRHSSAGRLAPGGHRGCARRLSATSSGRTGRCSSTRHGGTVKLAGSARRGSRAGAPLSSRRDRDAEPADGRGALPRWHAQ